VKPGTLQLLLVAVLSLLPAKIRGTPAAGNTNDWSQLLRQAAAFQLEHLTDDHVSRDTLGGHLEHDMSHSWP
jgi:hypothetical protein